MTLSIKSKSKIFQDTLWKISVDHYHQMIDAAILTTDDDVELLDGQIFEKMPKKPSHSHVTSILFHLLNQIIQGAFLIRNQEPITLETSEPEPDLAVTRGEFKTFRNRHPAPNEVVLIIEVADATLARDRNIKQRLYAAANIPEYWIVNLVDSQIEVFTEPTQTNGYNKQAIFTLALSSIPLTIDKIEMGSVRLTDLFDS